MSRAEGFGRAGIVALTAAAFVGLVATAAALAAPQGAGPPSAAPAGPPPVAFGAGPPPAGMPPAGFGGGPPGAGGPQLAGTYFYTLGTGGGPRVQVRRAQPANAVVVDGDVYLFDTGDGVLRQLAAAGLSISRIRAVFVSHHHFDHVAGLAPLLVNRWLLHSTAPLPVYGPPGTVAMLAGMAAASRAIELVPITIGGPPKPPIAATIAARDLPGDVTEPRVVYEDAAVRVSVVLNDHFHFPAGSPESESRSYAFRIDTKTRSFAYTGDTGPSERVVALARGVDVLVSEVIDLPSMEAGLRRMPGVPVEAALAHLSRDHLTPEQVGELAAAAGVRRLVLTHFVPGDDREADDSAYLRGIDRHFAGPVDAARDLERW
jgi:ribonuclease BN (tRNA processing enzyme)